MGVDLRDDAQIDEDPLAGGPVFRAPRFISALIQSGVPRLARGAREMRMGARRRAAAGADVGHVAAAEPVAAPIEARPERAGRDLPVLDDARAEAQESRAFRRRAAERACNKSNKKALY